MDKIFLTILNMSLTGSFVIAMICLVRLPLKKVPKVISYCLWAVAGFRLLFPFSIESALSLVPFKANTIPTDIATQPIPRIDSGIPIVNDVINQILPAQTPAYSVNPLQIWTFIGAYAWLAGAVIMIAYGMISFFVLKRKMADAAHSEANIYETNKIKSPFVLGIFTPRIFLPAGLSAKEREYIILHEQTHIRRSDHIVKFAAYFVLCLHWFNPLAWLAFLLMGVDMEMSCDEWVLKKIGGEMKKDYSLSLLSFAAGRRIIGGSPLAFSESRTKSRLKNVLRFKKSSRSIVIASVIAAALLILGFALSRPTDAVVEDGENSSSDSHIFLETNPRIISDSGYYDGDGFVVMETHYDFEHVSYTESKTPFSRPPSHGEIVDNEYYIEGDSNHYMGAPAALESYKRAALKYADFIEDIPESLYIKRYRYDETDDIVILVSNGAFKGTDGYYESVWLSVFLGKKGEEELHYLGDILSQGTSYPLGSDDEYFYAAGHHFVVKLMIDYANQELVIVEYANETYDSDGNESYLYFTIDDYHPHTAGKRIYTDPYMEDYSFAYHTDLTVSDRSKLDSLYAEYMRSTTLEFGAVG